MNSGPLAVEFRAITKKFGDCISNSDVSFSVSAGTIHGIVGENGAGKSTAMKILFGLLKPTSGTLVLDGNPVKWSAPSEAITAGIGMVHQHFMLAGPFSVLDNILLGAEPSFKAFAWLPAAFQVIDPSRARADLTQIINQYRLQVDLDAPLETLPVGLQQRVEILKLLYRRARILILDEPTAVLTPQETDELFKNLDRMRGEGKTILIITHKLKEVCRITDNITLFRQGRVVANLPTSELDEQKLADLMVGRHVNLTLNTDTYPSHLAQPEQSVPAGANVLNLNHVTLHHTGRRSHAKAPLENISLQVNAGEIVGIAGVEGNGQSELLTLLLHPNSFFAHGAAISEARLKATGSYQIRGVSVERQNAAQIKRQSVAFIPEDRQRQGLLLAQSAQSNFVLGYQRQSGFLSGGFLNRKKIGAHLRTAMSAFDIRPADPDRTIGSFSGGNQQKLIIAREMRNNPQFIIAAQPTRGVDVGAIEFIHNTLYEASRKGAGVLLVSSELEEILALSDRIVVMFEGKIVGEFQRGKVSLEMLGLCMGGGAGADIGGGTAQGVSLSAGSLSPELNL